MLDLIGCIYDCLDYKCIMRGNKYTLQNSYSISGTQASIFSSIQLALLIKLKLKNPSGVITNTRNLHVACAGKLGVYRIFSRPTGIYTTTETSTPL
jgi:hypothetical protein